MPKRKPKFTIYTLPSKNKKECLNKYETLNKIINTLLEETEKREYYIE